jgi:hypothetical protein
VSRPCSTCSRSDVDEIDAAIAASGSLRKIAAEFDTTDSAIRRHKEHSTDATAHSSPPDGPGRLRIAADALIAEVKARAGATYTAQDHAEAEYLIGVADLADANPTSVSAQREYRLTIAGFRTIGELVGDASDEELELVRALSGRPDLTRQELRR